MTTKISGDVIKTDTITASNIGANAVGNSEMADNAVGSAEIADGSIGLADLSAAATPVFTKSYTSAAQALTAAGTLTLAHGLGVAPALIQVRMKCINAAGVFGYAQNDEVIVNPSISHSAASRGMSIISDATNLNIRFGSDASSMSLIRRDTGGLLNVTNSDWNVIFKAWA